MNQRQYSGPGLDERQCHCRPLTSQWSPGTLPSVMQRTDDARDRGARQAGAVGRASQDTRARANPKTASRPPPPSHRPPHTWSRFVQFLGSRKRGKAGCSTGNAHTPRRGRPSSFAAQRSDWCRASAARVAHRSPTGKRHHPHQQQRRVASGSASV